MRGTDGNGTLEESNATSDVAVDSATGGQEGKFRSSFQRLSTTFSLRSKGGPSHSKASAPVRKWTNSGEHTRKTTIGPVSKFGLMRLHVGNLLATRYFDLAMGCVIMANSISIGLEQSARVERVNIAPYKNLERVYLVLYGMELGARYFAFGPTCLKDNWVKFDSVLVVFGIFSQLEPLLGQQDQLGPIMVIKVARLARLARAIRLLKKFRELWLLVHGVLSSASMMVYTLLVLFLILYIFGCVGMELITLRPNDAYPADVKLIIREYFSSLPKAMLTLVQFVCMDSVSSIYRPLILQEPFLAIYFVAVILVVAVVLMNIVTAVLVNGAVEQANQDREQKKMQEDKRRKELMRSLKDCFARLDEDGSNFVDREELLNASAEDQGLLRELMEASDPIEIFDALDIYGDGQLDIDEFCEGLYDFAVSKTPIEMKRIDKRVDSIQVSLLETRQSQDSLRDLLFQMHDELSTLNSWCHMQTREKTKEGISAASHLNAVPGEVASNIQLHETELPDNKLGATEPSDRTEALVVARSDTEDDMPPWAAQLVMEIRHLRNFSMIGTKDTTLSIGDVRHSSMDGQLSTSVPLGGRLRRGATRRSTNTSVDSNRSPKRKSSREKDATPLDAVPEENQPDTLMTSSISMASRVRYTQGVSQLKDVEDCAGLAQCSQIEHASTSPGNGAYKQSSV